MLALSEYPVGAFNITFPVNQLFWPFGVDVATISGAKFLIPKLTVDVSVLNYIMINFDNFSTNATNPEFRDNIIMFDVICHYD